MADPQFTRFLDLLKKSRLLAPVQERTAQAILANRPATVDQFARELVARELLTRWQADQLLKGQTGFVLQQYRLLSPVGRGGMGHVFRAQDDRSGAIVAIKVMSKKLTSNQTLVNRFRREIRASALLNSRHIVRTLDGGRVGKVDFMVMEYVNGDQLDRIVSRVGSIPIAVVCDIIRQAALGLQHAHERQMVHRDIKPGNLIVDWSPEGLGIVKIMDMGLVRLESDQDERTVTRAGQVMGTPDYMSPEQGWDTATVDIRSDIYSLGCTFFRLLTGRVPFPGDNPLQVLMARCSRDCPSARTLRSEIPEPIDAILRRMTLRDPSSRFQTPQEVANALEPFSLALSIEALRKAMKESGNDDAVLLELDSSADVNEVQDAGYQQFLREMETGAAVDLMISTGGGQGQVTGSSPGQFQNVTMPVLSQLERHGSRSRRATPAKSRMAGVIGLGSAGTIVALVALFMFVNRDTGKGTPAVAEVRTSSEESLPKAVLEASSQKDVNPGDVFVFTPTFESAVSPEVSEDQLQFRLGRNAPDGVTIDSASGKMEWKIPAGQSPASYPILIELVFRRDAVESVIASTTVVANVQPLSMNLKFPQMEPRIVRADELLKVDFAVSPKPSESLGLEYRLGADRTDAMKVDPKSGQFTWQPSEEDFGRRMVGVELFDPKTNRTLLTGRLALLVRPEIVLPTFPEQKAEAGKLFELQLFERPPRILEKGFVLRTAQGAPDGIEIDPRRGTLKWAVPSDASGRQEIRLVLESTSPRFEFKPLETVVMINVSARVAPEPEMAMSNEAVVSKETELRELMKKDIAGANTATERATLSRQLWNRALDQGKSVDDAALLKIALEIADRGRVTDMALELNHLQAMRYGQSEVDGAISIVKSFRITSISATQADMVIENLLRVSFDAISDKRFGDVNVLLGPIETLLKKAERGSLAKAISTDVEAARVLADQLEKNDQGDDAKRQELSRIIGRWQFSRLFGDPQLIAYVQSSETNQSLPDGGRSLWKVEDSRVSLTVASQDGSLGIIDTSRDSGRSLIRMQVHSKTTAAMFVFGAGREQNLNSWLLTFDNSEFGRIMRVPSAVNFQDPVNGTFLPGWNDLEILVDGRDVRVRLNGAAVFATQIQDLEPGRFGFLVPLQRSQMPTLDVRNPRIMSLPAP
ncbi:MAG: protein kinase domain-containing protein [Planctomycetota bacterium]